MAFQNGRLPDSALAPVPGGRLRRDAAAAFNAMYHQQVVAIRDSYRPLGHPGDLDRGVWSQWAAWEKHQRGGPLAAVPGTSNHGWGTAIDCQSLWDRQTIDRIGAKYGWSKSWSDAPGEWWHVLFKPGVFIPPKIWTPNLRLGSKGPNVALLNRRLFRLGYLPGADRGWRFTRATLGAVEHFQHDFHLTEDGVVGPLTWYAIKRAHKHHH